MLGRKGRGAGWYKPLTPKPTAASRAAWDRESRGMGACVPLPSLALGNVPQSCKAAHCQHVSSSSATLGEGSRCSPRHVKAAEIVHEQRAACCTELVTGHCWQYLHALHAGPVCMRMLQHLPGAAGSWEARNSSCQHGSYCPAGTAPRSHQDKPSPATGRCCNPSRTAGRPSQPLSGLDATTLSKTPLKATRLYKATEQVRETVQVHPLLIIHAMILYLQAGVLGQRGGHEVVGCRRPPCSLQAPEVCCGDAHPQLAGCPGCCRVCSPLLHLGSMDKDSETDSIQGKAGQRSGAEAGPATARAGRLSPGCCMDHGCTPSNRPDMWVPWRVQSCAWQGEEEANVPVQRRCHRRSDVWSIECGLLTAGMIVSSEGRG